MLHKYIVINSDIKLFIEYEDISFIRNGLLAMMIFTDLTILISYIPIFDNKDLF